MMGEAEGTLLVMLLSKKNSELAVVRDLITIKKDGLNRSPFLVFRDDTAEKSRYCAFCRHTVRFKNFSGFML